MPKPIPLALLLLLAAAPAQAAPINTTSKSGPVTLNSRPLNVGDRLNRPGDSVKTRDKTWAGFSMPSVRGSGNLLQNSLLKVRGIGKTYQLQIPRGVFNIKLLALKNGIQLTKQEQKPQPQLELIGPGEQRIAAVAPVELTASAVPEADGGGFCLGVDDGTATLDGRELVAGEAACVYADGTASARLPIDRKFELTIIPPPEPEPGQPEPEQGVCQVQLEPGNLLKVQGNLPDADGDEMQWLAMAKDGLFDFDYSRRRQVEVWNLGGEFKPYVVKGCTVNDSSE